MTANYSEALEQQFGLLARLDRQRTTDRIERSTHNVLHRAKTFFLSEQLELPIVVASRTVPKDWVLTKAALPAEAGFLWLNGDNLSMTFVQPHGSPYPDIDTNIKALIWGTGNIMAADSGVAHSGIVFQLAAPNVGVSVIRPLFEGTWRFGDSLKDAYARNAMSVNRKVANTATDLGQASGPESEFAPLYMGLNFFAAFCAFVEQKILLSTTQQAERHVRRRLERDGRTGDMGIQVIQLRRREYASAKAVESTDQEWSCQWLVRSHWHTYLVGKGRGQRQPCWITPYVKGDPAKPLKPPRATVFAVVR